MINTRLKVKVLKAMRQTLRCHSPFKRLNPHKHVLIWVILMAWYDHFLSLQNTFIVTASYLHTIKARLVWSWLTYINVYDCHFQKILFVLLVVKGSPAKAPPPLLSWDVVHEKMPWNILLLLGGGFALAHGSEVKQLILNSTAFSRQSFLYMFGRWCVFFHLA